MMNLFEIMQAAQGGRAVGNLSQQFGLSPQQRELVSTFARQHAAIALRPLLQVGATPGGVAHAADARCFLAWHRLQQHGRASRCVPVPGCCAACMACLQSEEPNQSINYI